MFNTPQLHNFIKNKLEVTKAILKVNVTAEASVIYTALSVAYFHTSMNVAVKTLVRKHLPLPANPESADSAHLMQRRKARRDGYGDSDCVCICVVTQTRVQQQQKRQQIHWKEAVQCR
eukprot:gene6622-330_t